MISAKEAREKARNSEEISQWLAQAEEAVERAAKEGLLETYEIHLYDSTPDRRLWESFKAFLRQPEMGYSVSGSWNSACGWWECTIRFDGSEDD